MIAYQIKMSGVKTLEDGEEFVLIAKDVGDARQKASWANNRKGSYCIRAVPIVKGA